MLALMSSDYKLLKREIEVNGAALRAERLAAEKAKPQAGLLPAGQGSR